MAFDEPWSVSETTGSFGVNPVEAGGSCPSFHLLCGRFGTVGSQGDFYGPRAETCSC